MWPDTQESAVTLTFDFDAEEVWVGEDPANAKKPGVLSQGTYGAKRGVPFVLDLLKRYGLTATFFIPGRVAERYPHRVTEVLEAGHEIALHGYTHSFPSDLSREQEDEELQRSIAIFRGLGGDPIGYRSPSADFSENTLSLLEKHGVKYDTSLMDDIYPYRLSDSLIELPMQWILDDAPQFWFDDVANWHRKIATPSEVRELWESEFLGIHERGGLFMLCMHPQIIGRPSRLKMLEGLVQVMIEMPGVWIAPARDIAAAADAALPQGAEGISPVTL